MKLGSMAWRNIWRRKRRTLITGFSIGFGVFLAVTFTGTGDYTYTKMIDTSARMGLGHVTVQPMGYRDTPSLDKRIGSSPQLRQRIADLPGVMGANERIMGQAMFASARKTVGGMFMAVNPASEDPQFNIILSSLVEGVPLDKSGGRGVLVGTKMAEKLKLRLGKKMVYTSTDANGEIVSAITRVKGIFKTGVNEVDSAMVLLPIDSVRATLNYKEDESTLISVVISDQRHSESKREQIAALVGSADKEVLTWRQTQTDLAGVIGMDRAGNYISQILVGLLIAAGILNTLLMSVLERSREFGVMMAVGMSPYNLFRLVIIESFYLALVGLLIGIVMTAPWYWYMVNTGIDFSASLGDEYTAGGVLIDPVMKIRLFKESVLSILAVVFSLAMISGVYPAWKAGRMPPVESLKTL